MNIDKDIREIENYLKLSKTIQKSIIDLEKEIKNIEIGPFMSKLDGKFTADQLQKIVDIMNRFKGYIE